MAAGDAAIYISGLPDAKVDPAGDGGNQSAGDADRPVRDDITEEDAG